MRDSRDRQLNRGSTHEDLLDTPSIAHPLTGPLAVAGAEPGDVLELEVLAYETDDFAWTAIWPGSGFLGDLFDRPFLARWELDGGHARSEQLPGVAIPACVHAGTIGVAPSWELFERARAREAAIGAPHPPDPELAWPPAGGRRAAHLPAARERRQHGHPRPRSGREAVAAGARARGAAVGRRPALRPGRRRGLHLGRRDRRLRHVSGRPQARRRMAPHLPLLRGAAASAARRVRHHRHPAHRRRRSGPARPQPRHPPRAARAARLARRPSTASSASPPTS